MNKKFHFVGRLIVKMKSPASSGDFNFFSVRSKFVAGEGRDLSQARLFRSRLSQGRPSRNSRLGLNRCIEMRFLSGYGRDELSRGETSWVLSRIASSMASAALEFGIRPTCRALAIGGVRFRSRFGHNRDRYVILTQFISPKSKKIFEKQGHAAPG